MAQAGWYNDPTGENQLRYFDGVNWTEEVAKHPESQESDIADFFDTQDNFSTRENNFQDNSFAQGEESSPIASGSSAFSTPLVEQKTSQKGRLKGKILPIVMVVLMLIVVYGKVSQDKTSPKPVSTSNKEIETNNTPVDTKNEEEIPTKEIPTEESFTEETYSQEEVTGVRVGDEKAILDKASSNFTKRVKSTGLILSHVNSKITTEVTLNPNGSIHIKNPKGYGVGDSKYLYLEPNLFLAYDGGKVIDKLVKNRGYSWVRLNLSNTQTGITFYSGKYYDGSNIALFWNYLKKYSSGITSTEGINGGREIMVDSLGGNDWATFYVDSNNNFTKVIIDGDTDISTVVTVKGNGKKTAKIPSSGFIKF